MSHTRRPDRRIQAVITAVALLLLVAWPARGAEPTTVTFLYTGGEQSFLVPDGVTTLHVEVAGAKGGLGQFGENGGIAAAVSGDLLVVPGDTLYLEVGGQGLGGGPGFPGPAGFNGGGAGGDASLGGGGGGGASDIRTIPRAQAGTLNSRLVVAGGGGGGAAGSADAGGGRGGNAGAPGQGSASSSAGGGGAGTTVSGGAPGASVSSGSALPGSLGLGGTGGGPSALASTDGGGGGGGGVFGGGGGGSAVVIFGPAGGGGGGGGASTAGPLTNSTVGLDPTLTPRIVITYNVGGSSSGALNADVTVPVSGACLELSTAAISFGTLPLGSVDQPATPEVTVTNCGGTNETIFASATDATGQDALWTLDDTSASCTSPQPIAVDRYHLDVTSPDVAAPVRLSTSNKSVQSLASGEDTSHVLQISTPCQGSTGSGRTMTMQVTYTATE